MEDDDFEIVGIPDYDKPPPKTNSPKLVSIEERRAIVQKWVAHFSAQGWRAVSVTDTSASLVRPKVFSLVWSCLWFLFFGLGLIVYLLWYWAKRDETYFIYVDEYGNVTGR